MKDPKAVLNTKRNKLLALGAALIVAVIGYVLVLSRAESLFVSVDPTAFTISGNAQLISEPDGSKSLVFKTPATTPPPTTPPPTTPPPTGGATTTCPLPKYPDATCTGVPASTVLTSKSGIIEVWTANTVIEGINLSGCIGVYAPGVIIRKSKITCMDGDAIVYNGEGGGRLLVEDSEITCNGKQGTAIVHSNYTARRLNIHNCENGFKMARNAIIEDSYIHDLISYNAQTDPHVDGIESVDGSESTINHNTIFGTNSAGSIGNAAININNSSGGPNTANVTISNNLLGGGGYTLYCPKPNTVNFQIINNRFSTKFHPNVGLYGPTTDCGSNEVKSGNVFNESGAVLTF